MNTIKDCTKFELNLLDDGRGKLIVIEGQKQTPFELKRLFYIFEADNNSVRGNHANKISEFVMTCPTGSCKVLLFDGKDETIVSLDSPNQALYIPNMIWKEMYDFSSGCVLLVIANTPYLPDEYIRDKAEYTKAMGVIND